MIASTQPGQPPLTFTEMFLELYILILYFCFVFCGYVLRYNLDTTNLWVLKINQEMVSIFPQVASVSTLDINVPLYQFYFAVMWVFGLLGFFSLGVMKLNNYYRDSPQPIYKIIITFLGSGTFVVLLNSFIIFKKTGYLYLTFNSLLSPFFASLYAVASQMFFLTHLYTIYLLAKNFKRFILGANDVR